MACHHCLIVADIVELSNGDVAVLKLTNVQDVQLDPNSAEYKAVKDRMENAAGNVEFSWYEHELQKAAKIIRKDNKEENEQE